MRRRPPQTYSEWLDREAGRWLHRAWLALHLGSATVALEAMAIAVERLAALAGYRAGVQ